MCNYTVTAPLQIAERTSQLIRILYRAQTTTINLLYASSSSKKVKILHALADSAMLACS